MVFLPVLISDRWPSAVDGSTADNDGHYETIGPGVFRFEYYYLLKNGNAYGYTLGYGARPNQTTLTNPQSIGLADVESITVALAVVDSAGRALITAASPDQPR